MTDKQLEKLGIHFDGSKISPNLYWCNSIQEHIVITRQMSGEEILSIVFENGYSQGVEDGKAQRSEQLKNLINNV